MSEFSEIRKGLSNLETLEQKLNLKQLQINRLLQITQAINNNLKAKGLYDMYKSFLSWEMGVKRMALYIKEEGDWVCASHTGLEEELIEIDIRDKLPKYQRLKNIDDDTEHPLIGKFDIVVPVLHKQIPIAYTFIGGFDTDDDMYNKVQFITTITNVIAVAIENKRLFKRQLEQTRLKRELELAIDMQHMLIPADLPKSDDFELASIYKPHLGVGGDYFDFVQLDEETFVFCIADISGKGLAAALLMANFQAIFHALIVQRHGIKEFIFKLNQSLFRITGGEKFLTFFLAEYNVKTRELKYVNAGHNPPILAMANQMYHLKAGCTILGSFRDLPGKVEVGNMQLDQEAIVVTYTDGLTDIQNEGEDYFNEKLLEDFVKHHYTLSAEQFNEKLVERIEEFKGEQTYPDDCTVLTCKIFGE